LVQERSSDGDHVFFRQWKFFFIANGEGVFKIKIIDICKKKIIKKFVFLNSFYYLLKYKVDLFP